MRLSGERHLSYCSNVHAGESYPQLLAEVLPSMARVKAQVAPSEPFGVGLRVSAQAAQTLSEPDAQAQLQRSLAQHDLYVFTLNGFPYGAFHAGKIKEAVYRPDWRDERRLAYSNTLAELLAALLPSHVSYGSVSTVPLGFAPDFSGDDHIARACQLLLQHVAFLAELEQRCHKRIVLALEPEPWCVLERGEHCVRLFERFLRAPSALAHLSQLTGQSVGQAAALLQRHLGLCLDACHAAVEYEQPGELLAQLRARDIPIYKLQLSAGLDVPVVSHAARAALNAFAEDVYLHQVVERRAGTLTRYRDLTQALESEQTEPRSWRIHFHVPIYQGDYGLFGSTQALLEELLGQLSGTACRHFEVETYTWSVLPPALRGATLTDDITSELTWARARL